MPVGEAGFPAATQPVDSEYHIGPLDQLRLVVFREPDLSANELPVSLSGKVALPLLGEIDAKGLTADELARQITALLNARYLRDARVSVSVTKAENFTFTVDGQVKKPGVYDIPGHLTLMQAIAMGEGATEYARLSEVVIFRTIDGKKYAARFDLKDIRSGVYPDPAIQQSDIVVVGYDAATRIYRDFLTSLPGLAGLFVALRN